jgi:CCR4-NOT transcription complex subunit 9
LENVCVLVGVDRRGGDVVLQVGLNYICATAERFFAVGAVLGNMVVMLAEQPSPRLLKHIIRCYLRLSDNPR